MKSKTERFTQIIALLNSRYFIQVYTEHEFSILNETLQNIWCYWILKIIKINTILSHVYCYIESWNKNMANCLHIWYSHQNWT